MDENSRKREDDWFLQNEKKLLEDVKNAREKREAERRAKETEDERARLKQLHWMKCPKCGHDMKTETLEGIDFRDTTSESERRLGTDRTRHRLREQGVHRVDAEHLQHRGDVVGRRSDVTAGELVGLDQRVQRSWGSGFGHGEASCGGSDFPGCHRYLRVFARASPGFPRR